MRSFPRLLTLVIATILFLFSTGCQEEKKETSLLDDVAAALEERAPFYFEQEGVHLEFISPSGKWSATADVNRVEIMEREGYDLPEVMLRNSVKFRLMDSAQAAILELTANEGELLPNRNLAFRKGVLLDFGEGIQLEADAIEINRATKRITSGSELRLFTRVRPSENDSTQLAILEGDSLTASYSLEDWQIWGLKGYLPVDDAGAGN